MRTGVNAGIDMFMEPHSAQSFEQTLTDEVTAGRVSKSRIDDAVRRILTKKFELGLFEHPFTDRTHLGDVGSPAHRDLARRAVAESQVLLRNRDAALPVHPGSDVYVAGSNADNIGNQAGGWTLTWQGGSTNVIPGHTILDGIREANGGGTTTFSEDASASVPPDATGVVVVGETPYSEGFGDVGGPQWARDNGVPRPVKDMQLSAADKTAVDRVCAAAAKCVVVVVSGRPLILDPPQLDADGRPRGRVAAGQRGRGSGRHPVRQPPVHRQAAGDVAEDARPGADQRRRRQLRPAVPVRVRSLDLVGEPLGHPVEEAAPAGSRPLVHLGRERAALLEVHLGAAVAEVAEHDGDQLGARRFAGLVGDREAPGARAVRPRGTRPSSGSRGGRARRTS